MNTKTFYTAEAAFEAARQIDGLAPGHRAGRLHGHGFAARVRCAIPAGWADFPGGEVAQLQQRLDAVVGLLDYRCLNDQLADPSDIHLARWLGERLADPALGRLEIGVDSTDRQGAMLDAAGQAHVWRRYVFQSAHQLPNVPAGHKCGRMHGHGFEVIVQARAEGGVDYERLDAVWAPLQDALHYACLNEIAGLENPTSEMMSSWIWERLHAQLPSLSLVTVYETASCGARFDGRQYRIWKDLTLDSARQLRRAPEGSAHRRLHGHTYTLRLHLSAPLDRIMGWTVDFGDVKELFNPLFKALDHRPLHEIADLDDCDTASVAHWILARARPDLPQLDGVDLFETRGCGAQVAAQGVTP
ncbi:6-carboxytetrahydropterin synthase [Pantoea sp. 18069]|uniref:6-pyruvoyl trahydropterin synthase family protein n=1 Tax=Pantoea sp. 18069 TaxID=2681415 RepID=UPI001357A80E|nr:6-carboxytetrahydropterin synthase [Pantoea sp. 18069]